MSRNIVTINSPVWNDYNHDVITFILSQFLLHNTSVKNNSWMFSFFVKRIMFKRQFTHAGKRDTNWFLPSFAVSLKRPRISRKVVFFLSVFQKEHSLTKSCFPISPGGFYSACVSFKEGFETYEILWSWFYISTRGELFLVYCRRRISVQNVPF